MINLKQSLRGKTQDFGKIIFGLTLLFSKWVWEEKTFAQQISQYKKQKTIPIEIKPIPETIPISKHYWKGLLSHEGSALAMGIEYQEDHPGLTWGTHLLFLTGRENTLLQPQLFTVGASVYFYFYQTASLELGVAPNLYLARFKNLAQNETTLGPGIRWILSIPLGPKLRTNGEIWYLSNWANSQLPPYFMLSTLGFKIEL